MRQGTFDFLHDENFTPDYSELSEQDKRDAESAEKFFRILLGKKDSVDNRILLCEYAAEIVQGHMPGFFQERLGMAFRSKYGDKIKIPMRDFVNRVIEYAERCLVGG